MLQFLDASSLLKKNLLCFLSSIKILKNLNLIGMRQGTFHPLYFFDQNLSAFRLFWHSAKIIESYKKFPLVAQKMSIFLVY